MTFHNPWVLLLLLLIPPAILYFRSFRRQSTILFSEVRSLPILGVSWRIRTAWIPSTLFGLACTCLVVALARPQRGLEESRVHADVVDIVLLVDVSTSMRAEDFSTAQKRMNRLDAAKEVIQDFVEKRENDRIGMVAFSALPYTVSPLTLDHSWLLSNLDRVQTGMLEDGTAIGTAIASAVNRLRDSEASSKVIILLTDGVNNSGTLSPENAALAAEALGIRIYTIGAESTGYTGRNLGLFNMAQRVEIDEKTLTQIANLTGGRYYRAQDFSALKEVYRQIDELEKTDIEVEQFKRYEEKYRNWLIAGLVLLLTEQLLAATLYRRLPE